MTAILIETRAIKHTNLGGGIVDLHRKEVVNSPDQVNVGMRKMIRRVKVESAGRMLWMCPACDHRNNRAVAEGESANLTEATISLRWVMFRCKMCVRYVKVYFPLPVSKVYLP